MPVEGPSSTPCVVCQYTFNTLGYILRHFSIEGGVGINDQWPPSVGNSWRTTNDIQDNWASMINNIDLVRFEHVFHIRISFSFFRITMLLISQDQEAGMIQIVRDSL